MTSSSRSYGNGVIVVINKKSLEVQSFTGNYYSAKSLGVCESGDILFYCSISYSNTGLYLFKEEDCSIDRISTDGYFLRNCYVLPNGNWLIFNENSNTNCYIFDPDVEEIVYRYVGTFSPSSLVENTDFKVIVLPNNNVLLISYCTHSPSYLYIYHVDCSSNCISLVNGGSGDSVDNVKQLVDGNVLIAGANGLFLYDYSSNTVKKYFSNGTVTEIIDNEDGTYTIKFEDFNDVIYSAIKKQFYLVYEEELVVSVTE